MCIYIYVVEFYFNSPISNRIVASQFRIYSVHVDRVTPRKQPFAEQLKYFLIRYKKKTEAEKLCREDSIFAFISHRA